MNANVYTRLLSISSVIIAGILISQLFINSAHPQGDTLPRENNHLGTYAIQSLEIPKHINFCNELVPISRYYVKENLDRELLVNTYWQSQTILFIKRANRYLPIIEPILKEHNIPDDFKYLSLIESSFLPRAISPSGAAGLWQFMKVTGKEYGLEVNKEVDERYNIEKATHAACKYLKKMHDHYGSWTTAAASYNAGRNGINKRLENQKADNYYDLLLGEETGRYVYRIIALKEIMSHPEKYGFQVKEEHKYKEIPHFDYAFNGSIVDIAAFTKAHQTTYKEFKDLNPWLRENTLTNSSKKTYVLKMPLASQSSVIDKTKQATADSIASK